jgi:DNA-binding NarL/FixJ family response regulator
MAVSLRAAGAALPEVDPIQVGEPVRVGLADDHVRALRDLRRVLDGDAGIVVVAESGEGVGAVDAVGTEPDDPNVVVLDVRLSDGAGVATIQQLRERLPGTALVVLSCERNPVFALRALDAGARAYVVRGGPDEELRCAVRAAANGTEYVSPSVALGLEAQRGADRGAAISRRETEVLRLIALGYTSAEIARELHVSRRTVDSHRASIHRKLGVRTRAGLVQFALARGLLG